MTRHRVTVDAFVRAETDRLFETLVAQAGGVNRLCHHRTPTPLDDQPVIRMNRDTLYSFAIVDLAAGAVLTVPDAAGRYLSVMIVNQDHYVNRIIHDAGNYELTVAEFDTRYVLAGIRVLVDPDDPDDVAAVAELQDGFSLEAASAEPFAADGDDADDLDAIRNALLELGRHTDSFAGAFGAASEVDPVAHLIGTATGFGGLPASEAFYLNVEPGLPVGRYRLDVPHDVPVGGFWSISVYNADGYFPITDAPVSVNSVTAAHNDDGSVTVHFGDWNGDTANRVTITEGWNYLVRLYRPHADVLDGSWQFPNIVSR
jgi:hypothetical protein